MTLCYGRVGIGVKYGARVKIRYIPCSGQTCKNWHSKLSEKYTCLGPWCAIMITKQSSRPSAAVLFFIASLSCGIFSKDTEHYLLAHLMHEWKFF